MNDSPTVTIQTPEVALGRPPAAPETPKQLVMKVAGELSLPPGTEYVEREFNRACASRPQLVVLDLSDLSFVSSLGMGILLRFRGDIARNGGDVRIAGARPNVRDALYRARIDSLIRFTESVEAALA